MIEIEARIMDLLGKFSNSGERFNTDAMFKNCIMSIANGVSPYDIIDSLLGIIKNQGEELMNKETHELPRFIVTTEEFETYEKSLAAQQNLAMLIDAAPDMLEALYFALTLGKNGQAHDALVIQKIESAIKKAKGE